jgi:hypothetical protein
MIAVPIVGSTQVSPGSKFASSGIPHPSLEGAQVEGSTPLVIENLL